MDFFKTLSNIGSNIVSGVKNFFGSGAGQANIGGFTPANTPPNTTPVQFIQQGGVVPIASGTPVSTPAFLTTKPSTYEARYNPTDLDVRGNPKPGTQPVTSQYTPTVRSLSPTISPIITPPTNQPAPRQATNPPLMSGDSLLGSNQPPAVQGPAFPGLPEVGKSISIEEKAAMDRAKATAEAERIRLLNVESPTGGAGYINPAPYSGNQPSGLGITGATAPLSILGQGIISLPTNEEEKTKMISEGKLIPFDRAQGLENIRMNVPVAGGGTQQGGSQYFQGAGGLYVKQEGLGYVKVPTLSESAPAGVPNANLSNPINLANAQNNAAEIARILSAPGSLTSATRSQLTGLLKGYVDNYSASAGAGTPGSPVVETANQYNYVNQSGDPVGIRAQMDSYRKSIGLPDLEKSKIDTQSKINGLTEGLQKIIDDIRNNPELPKSLSAKRIAEFTRQVQPTLLTLNNQLSLITSQIQQANDSLDREFKVRQFEFEQKKPVSMSATESVFQFNPSTGQYEQTKAGTTESQQKEMAVKYQLAQTYPDAGIDPNTDTLATAQAKAANAPSFAAKNTNLKSTTDAYGNTVIFDAKGGYVGTSKPDGSFQAGPAAPNAGLGDLTTNPGATPPTSSFNQTIKNLGEQVINTGDWTSVPTRLKTQVNNYIAAKSQETGELFIPGKSRDSLAAFNNVKSVLEQLTDDVNKVFASPISSFGSALGQNIPIISQLTQLTPNGKDVAIFNSHANGYLALIARASGEKGVLTDPDVARAKQLLPNIYYDTPDTAITKIQNAKDFFQSIVQKNIQTLATGGAGTQSQQSQLDLSQFEK